MFRDLLSSRLIQAGLVFFVLVVGGSLLYSWHAHRSTRAEFGPIPQPVVSPPENAPAKTVPIVFQDDGVMNAPDDTTAAETVDETEPMDLADAFDPDDFVLAEEAEEAPEEDVPVSPFGFGPYPEVPADYPLTGSLPWLWSEERKAQSEENGRDGREFRGISFTEYLKEYELMGRVGIKLWNEGRVFGGITTLDQTGRFYPDEPDILYVKWAETTSSDGKVRRYMANTIGSALQNMPIAAMQGREPPPDWIEIRSFNEGIDPYEYLGLNR